MLTYTEYSELWLHYFMGVGYGLPAAPPNYIEYLQRCIYKQDYLDLFTGTQTYHRVPLPGGRQGVLIPVGHLLGLALPMNNLIVNNNQKYVVVKNYPWNDEQLGGYVNRELQYFLIAEAPPENMNNYVYYLGKDAVITNFFSAPYNAIVGDVLPEKTTALLDLANTGCFIDDIFPFAVRLSTNIRNLLNNHGFTLHHWNLFNNSIGVLHIQVHHLTEVKSTFIAPMKISYHLAFNINFNALANHGLLFANGFNTFIPPIPAPLTPNMYYTGMLGAVVNCPWRIGLHFILPHPLSRVPVYACTASSGAGYPHNFFIKLSLGLL